MLPSHTAAHPPSESRAARDRARLRAGERGAVLVHAAFAIAGLLAFSAISIDLGALWVSRGQIQNAADAAALAGAADLAYGVQANAPTTAQAVAQAHSVWGQSVTAASVPTPLMGPCPARPTDTREPAGECLRVLVERRTSSGTQLPVYFSQIFGATAEVWASAQAGVLLDNATPCPRPFGILDRFTDTNGDGRYTLGEPYVPPAAGGGFSFTNDVGTELTVTLYTGPAGTGPSVGEVIPLDLPGAGGNAVARYEANIASCSADPISLGDVRQALVPAPVGSTADLVNELFNSDPAARWDAGSRSIRGSLYPVSPRLVTIAVLDPRDLSGPFHVVNLVGLLMDEVTGGSGGGVLVPMAGSYDPEVGVLSPEATFLRTVTVVR